MKIFGLEVFQMIVILFTVFALSRVMMQKRQNNFSWNELFFWSIIWVGLVIVSFSRDYLQNIAEFLGISRGVDILIYGGITFLFYMVYRLYAIVDQQQQEITTLVTKIAINNAKDKKNKK